MYEQQVMFNLEFFVLSSIWYLRNACLNRLQVVVRLEGILMGPEDELAEMDGGGGQGCSACVIS